ncbi:MAG TPA: response regulator [Thermoanaerobaculia bacterium]|nr:response regulator [Thermoanaerobaculia bacterium]
MKRSKRRTPGRRTRGSLDWVRKRPIPVVNILIADRDRATRAAATRVIQSLRGMRIVGEAKSGLEAVSATARLKPRVVLLDLKLSTEFGATLVSVLRRKSARTRVILLVGRAPEAKILEALSHGAVGCVTKKDLARFLPEALVAVSSGEAWMSRKLIPKIMDRLAAFTARAEGQ